MDRCALFVDAGYALGDGALAVHGTRNRDSVSWDYAGLLKLLGGMSRDRTGLPLLRCYWYDVPAAVIGTAGHDTLGDLPGVKLRLSKARSGRKEGVEAEIRKDLTALARNHAVSDVIIVSADEDLAPVIAEVQEFGVRALLLHVVSEGGLTGSRALRQECDDVIEVSPSHLRPYVEFIAGAEPQSAVNPPAQRLFASPVPAGYERAPQLTAVGSQGQDLGSADPARLASAPQADDRRLVSAHDGQPGAVQQAPPPLVQYQQADVGGRNLQAAEAGYGQVAFGEQPAARLANGQGSAGQPPDFGHRGQVDDGRGHVGPGSQAVVQAGGDLQGSGGPGVGAGAAANGGQANGLSAGVLANGVPGNPLPGTGVPGHGGAGSVQPGNGLVAGAPPAHPIGANGLGGMGQPGPVAAGTDVQHQRAEAALAQPGLSPPIQGQGALGQQSALGQQGAPGPASLPGRPPRIAGSAERPDAVRRSAARATAA